MKKFIFITLLFIVSFAAFAAGANEGRLFYLPRNVANNSSVMIELTQAKALTTVDATYSNTSTNNLAIFRLRDSINSSDQPTGTAGTTITISSENNWYFINENNPTQKVRFELNCFVVDRKRNSREYETKVSVQAINGTTTLSQSGSPATWNKVGNNYQLTLPTTDFSKSLASMYANFIREADICVVIPENTDGLESGYYSTTITFVTTSYQEHTIGSDWTGKIMVKDGSPKVMTETITIRGYVGIDPGEQGQYSFTVSQAADTYSMNLGITNQSIPYDVANVKFSYTDIVNSSPNTSTQSSKFALYISPTNVYGVDGTYQFIKMGSEHQARSASNTLYYDLYAKSSAGYTKMGSSATWSDTVASISKYNSTHTWKVVPKYSSEQISSSGLLGGETRYRETWTLDLEVYLKLTSASLAAKKDTGLYYSYIYVTLVAN